MRSVSPKHNRWEREVKLQYNVTRMDDNLKQAIHGLRKVRFRTEPEYKPYVSYAIWVMVMLRHSAVTKGLQLIFCNRHMAVKQPFKLEPFSDSDIQQARKDI